MMLLFHIMVSYQGASTEWVTVRGLVDSGECERFSETCPGTSADGLAEGHSGSVS